MSECSGYISINNIDILSIPIKKLRDQIITLSQDVFVMNGTLRENLDPNNIFTDFQLLQEIKSCGLYTLLMKDGFIGDISLLELEISSSISQGQKVLISLCRSMLKVSKLILVDEINAFMDNDTSLLVDQYILSKVNAYNATLLYICHKYSMETFSNSGLCNRIIELSNGKIIKNEKIS